MIAPALLLLGLQATAIPPAAPAVAANGSVPIRTFDVEVRAGDAPLWRGALRVGDTGASFEMSQMEAPEAGCVDQQDRFQGDHRSLHVNLSRAYGVNAASQVSVSVSWTYPADGSCAAAAGSRTVGIDQIVTVNGTTPFVLFGERGLSIRLVAR